MTDDNTDPIDEFSQWLDSRVEQMDELPTAEEASLGELSRVKKEGFVAVAFGNNMEVRCRQCDTLALPINPEVIDLPDWQCPDCLAKGKTDGLQQVE